nr:class I SAM-dependent methyltransferase [uncultured Undibacterium sp.]
MLLPNNNEIDVNLLSKKIEVIKSRKLSTSYSVDHNESMVVPQIQFGDVVPKTLSRRLRLLFFKEQSIRRQIGRIPILGSALIWINSIFRLNSIRHKIALDFDLLKLQNQQLQDIIRLNQRVLSDQQSQLRSQLQNQHAQISERMSALEHLSLQTRIQSLESVSQQVSNANIERDNRLANLVREIRQINTRPTPVPEAQVSDTKMVQRIEQIDEVVVPGLDGFYLEFEDNFRGTPEDISARLQVYLPYLSRFANDATATVVDIGCGRGEWLKLLQKNSIQAVGIDMNSAMVDACVEQGLIAYCQDAIKYLQQQPESSLAAITGFHIIEHLPFKLLLSLFDAALRALRSDGVIVFETPNPENLAVGACNFYFDPTHLNPIVPAVAQFMAKQRGFAKAEILRLHPYPDDFKVVEDSELAKRFNAALYGPQDFAVIAWKTNAN